MPEREQVQKKVVLQGKIKKKLLTSKRSVKDNVVSKVDEAEVSKSNSVGSSLKRKRLIDKTASRKCRKKRKQ